MKKFVTRTLTLLMAFMLLVCAVACSDPNENPVVTTEAPVADVTTAPEDTKLVANIPDVKYNCDFNIASGYVTETKYTCNDIVETELDGDIIKDSIYRRTVSVEEKLGIKIIVHDVNYSKINAAVKTDTGEFDIGTATLSEIMNIVNNGSAIDMHDCTTIDLSMPWWDQNAQAKLCIGEKLFYTFSDFFITGLDNARAIYFNKTLAEEVHAGDIYSLITKNEWTIEKMRELGLTAVSNLDGDDKFTTKDRLGIVNNVTTFYEVMLTGCDAEIMKQGENGIPYSCCIKEKDYFVAVYNKLLDLFSTDNVYLVTATADGRDMFMNNQALFTCDTLYYASKMRNESNIEFGIMPVPKYNAEQENYMHVSPNPDAFFIIPAAEADVERVGVILETLSYYSSSYFADDALIPSYFDLALTYRSAKDVESAESLQIVHDNISYVIKIIGTTFSNQIFTGYFATGNRGVASLIDQQKVVIEKQLAAVLKNLGVTQ